MKTNLMDGLLEELIIDQQSFDLVEAYCRRWKVQQFEGLLETRVFEEETLLEILSKRYHIPIFTGRVECDISNSSADQVLYIDARKLYCFPLEEGSNEVSKLWIANPYAEGIQDVCPEVPRVLGTRYDIVQAICEYYPLDRQCPNLGGECAS
ncbi:MAG: hypothetical protein AB8C84_12415 [Oligoflexales bacterium]